MKKRIEEYKRFILTGIIVIALGISFNSGLGDSENLGTVFVAIGGLLFIIGMSKKKEEENINTH